MKSPAIAALILAAGASSRAGTLKPLALIDNTPMIVRTIENARASRAKPVIVVIGNESLRVSEAYSHLDVPTVLNAHWKDGMSTSLVAGLAEMSPRYDGCLILLGDMPFVRPATLNALIDAFDPTQYDAVQPSFDGTAGNPVLLGRSLFETARSLKGDHGARSIVAGLGERLLRLPVEDPGILRDLDTATELEEAQ